MDLLVFPVIQDERNFTAGVDEASGGELTAAFERGEFKGKPCEIWTTQLGERWTTKRVAMIGVGLRAELNVERVRRMAACAGIAARQQHRSRLALHVPTDWTNEAWIEAIAEGATFANFDNGHYKSRDEGRFFLRTVQVGGITAPGAAEALERGRRIGEAVNAARVLINEPGNTLTPR